MGLKIAESSGEPILPPIIPDLSLLLTVWGPWLVLRLSRLAQVWLPRALVRLRAGEALLINDAIDQRVLDLWANCWPELVQQQRVHWFDQDLVQSHAPKGESPALLDRLNTLATELHERMESELRGEDLEPLTLMLEGVVAAVALAAALPEEPPVVLCRLLDGETEPYVCGALRRFNLVPCHLAREGVREMLSRRLVHGLVGAGLGPLLGAEKIRLAALYVAMPRSALPLPPARSAPAMIDTEAPTEQDLELNNLCSLVEEGCGPFWDEVIVAWHEVR
jgi:hypothetical protein